MSSDYDWNISRQATERIIQLPKAKRERLIAHFDLLAQRLERLSEAEFTDANGATHYITHWIPGRLRIRSIIP